MVDYDQKDIEELNKLELQKEKLYKTKDEIKRLQQEHNEQLENIKKAKKEFEENGKLNRKCLYLDEIYNWGTQILERVPYVTLEDTKEMWIYTGDDNGCYSSDGDIYLEKLCARSGPRANDPNVLKKLRMKIMGDSYKKREDFINPPNLINLKNGVVDMDSNTLLTHNKNYYFQSTLNANYDKEAKCPVWENSLRKMFNNDEEGYIRTQKWFGYQFIRENKEQIAHGYVGPAASGKSMMLHILVEMLGKKNVTNFELQDFSGKVNDYATGSLYGKIANINFDMNTTQIKDISIFKKLTSGDCIKGRNIYEKYFEFVNYAKMSWACNKLPYMTDSILMSPEFRRRVMITETVKGYDIPDKDIYTKYLKELHSGGIINWLLEGRKLYIDEKGFNYKDYVPDVWKFNMDIGFEMVKPNDNAERIINK